MEVRIRLFSRRLRLHVRPTPSAPAFDSRISSRARAFEVFSGNAHVLTNSCSYWGPSRPHGTHRRQLSHFTLHLIAWFASLCQVLVDTRQTTSRKHCRYCNVGDMLSFRSEKRLKSCLHRVVPGAKNDEQKKTSLLIGRFGVFRDGGIVTQGKTYLE